MDLRFDKMTVDTTLAQKYLDQYTELSQLVKTGKQQDFTIYPGGKQNYTERKTEQITLKDVYQRLKQFAVLLKENTNLITQLEYLMRKIPIEDTTAQINLIVQQIRYVASSPAAAMPLLPILFDRIKMNNDSPLLVLGYIAKIYQDQLTCFLDAEDTMAPVCHLVTKLCHEARLPVVTTLSSSASNSNETYTEVPAGAVGVVSECSDVDSAVDVLLSSSKYVPWRLRKILVQESVYQQFKNALTWKCNLNKPLEGKDTDSDSDSMYYKGREFLIDVVGTMKPQPTAVTIEAYRTRKELKTMLNQLRPHYLSLWANDIAEINEVTHGIRSSVVWVNNFGDFRGPPKASEAVYSYAQFGITYQDYVSSVQKSKKLCELLDLKQSWLKLNRDARYNILFKALNECVATEAESKRFEQLKEDLCKMEGLSGLDAFIDIGQNYVCQGVTLPASELFMIEHDFLCVEFLKSLLYGNAFAIYQPKIFVQAIDVLKKAGVPIIAMEKSDMTKGDLNIYYRNIEHGLTEHTSITKVIWTNSGTVFAN